VCFTSTKQGREEREPRTSRMANTQREDRVGLAQHNRCTECTNLAGSSVLYVNETGKGGERVANEQDGE
jgi:hypothetical protein